MKRFALIATVFLGVGFLAGRLWQQAPVSAEGQGGGTPSGNGDVNGDGALNLTDAIYLLQHLFQGGPAPVPLAAKATALPATGQTKCYDDMGNEISCDSADFPGQDGFYQAGCPMEGRFVDNGDGTVTDNCTGLMWQKETAPGNYTWQGALKYCQTLDLAGHSDWHLPNVRELESMWDYARFDPILDPVFVARPGWHWSSSYDSFLLHYAFAIHLYTGNIYLDSFDKKDPSKCVRAVRNVQ